MTEFAVFRFFEYVGKNTVCKCELTVGLDQKCICMLYSNSLATKWGVNHLHLTKIVVTAEFSLNLLKILWKTPVLIAKIWWRHHHDAIFFINSKITYSTLDICQAISLSDQWFRTRGKLLEKIPCPFLKIHKKTKKSPKIHENPKNPKIQKKSRKIAIKPKNSKTPKNPLKSNKSLKSIKNP